MDTQNPPPDQPLSKDRLQDKADILESNLFNIVSKQEDRTCLHIQVSREQYPDTVIIRALLQLFPRVNIKGSKILVILKKMMDRTIPEGSQLKTQKGLLNLAGNENPDLARLSLTLTILLTSKLLHLTIEGTPVIPSQNGTIAESHFDSESCPGAVKKDGKIDFREINKYPIVKTGDQLFFITTESQGKPGMEYDGHIVQVPTALPLELNLNGGVNRVDRVDDQGNIIGHFLVASKTGVVLLTRIDDKISGIEISDELDVKRLDYSTGNIGTKFLCPISMKIDTICSGFRIRARGKVEANVLEGGEIETDSQAIIKIIEPDSKVTAQKDIIFHFARHAILSSETGCITILDELMDSTLFSTGISFKKNRGTLTNSILDAETISLENIYFCGENTLYFGRRLFSDRQALLDTRKNLEEEMLSLNEKEKELMEQFLHELKRLTKTLKTNPMLRENIKNLILATRTMDFDTLDSELETISKLMNTKEVATIKKQLATLKQIKNKYFKDQEEELKDKIQETNHKMSAMSLTIEGLLRRAATLKIYTGARDNDLSLKPAVFIESEKSQDTLIKIQGTYNTRQGFKIIQD
jgi:uncharacterized protein (DUF342 family)